MENNELDPQTEKACFNQLLEGDSYIDDLTRASHQFGFGYNKPTSGAARWGHLASGKVGEWAGTGSQSSNKISELTTALAEDDEGEYNYDYAEEGFNEFKE